MIIRKAFRFRLKTNSDLAQKLDQFSGCARFVWNRFWSMNKDRLNRKQPILWYNEMAFWVTVWKDSVEYGFLKNCHSQILQQSLKDLDKAYRDGFDKMQPLKRMPNKHKKSLHNSFRYPQGFKIEGNRLYLPKIGWVRFFKSQEIIGKAKNITLSKKGNHWYAAIQVEYEAPVPVHPSQSDVGIDVGIKKFAALSTEKYINPINSFRSEENKLRKYQQKLSRKEKFSKNWQKAKLKVSRIHERIGNVRRDFLHKSSTILSKNHAMIVVEDLKIANMSRSAKGSKDEPGKNVAAKSGLNKSILDQGWGEFRRQLEYKQEWSGGIFLKVNPKNTSITCKCGNIDKYNRVSQSEFCCTECGHRENADIHAAKTVLAAGHAVLACESNLSKGRKQELLRKRELRSV